MSVSLSEILNAFEFIETGGGAHSAILCRRSGKIYCHAEFSDLEEFNDELPDDVEDDEKYIAIDVLSRRPQKPPLVSETRQGHYDRCRPLRGYRAA